MKIVFLLFSSILSVAAFAQQVTQSEALNLAQKFMSAKANKSIQLKTVSYETKGISHMYFFTDEANTSFVVIAGEKITSPVIAYSTESGLDEVLPAPVADYFLGTEAKLVQAKNNAYVPDKSVEEEWESIAANGKLPVYLKSAVTPLLSTTWNQDCYYNDSVPEHASGPCGHCYAGCVATAMGQVLKYHNYPSVGVGYNVYGTGAYSHIRADFDQASYNWAAMPNSINTYNEPVAQLLFHLGVSVNMGYAFDGSGANSSDAAAAMRDHFSYSDYLFYAEKDMFPESIWLQVVVNDLKSRRPIYYSGYGTGGGHAFVCDGIDNSNKMHINWGWGGSANGYFTFSNLGGFTDGQGAIFGVEPETGDIEYCVPSAVYTAATDTIEDGSGVNRYGNNTNCSWTIQPPGAGLIYIHFTKLALDQDMDVAYVYNGTSTADPLVKSVTGFDLPQEILVWGPSAYVVFQSDAMLRADGFEFYYTSSLVGIEDAWNEGKITVFPNPADDRMNIEIDPLILPAIERIELISLNGQIVTVVENPVQSQCIEVGALNAGTYGLRFTGAGDSFFSFVEIQ
ncbi:MAG: hypothetical protein A2W93_10940 [Bacteroidetes bacterium GWF2_43_63]|nr:MAG: hypothetical protein A2W94_00205 [Bacteroidetes bacterium GWE2_42_42]OFY56430.1 MAG: hypothetical protein A2W93_10940 [Bacteroidetes bacterium GWF2_43_63]HBG72006.1 hypothetical protein [Bacteroidales bacterium]HCB63040.1 hypothetical protein [Bacteroidales bacterium]HCY23258.1 hypothetical protein [Bacteroidales bacterium]